MFVQGSGVICKLTLEMLHNKTFIYFSARLVFTWQLKLTFATVMCSKNVKQLLVFLTIKTKGV